MSGLIARWARLSSLAASAGASLIGFLQAGAGAVARTLQAKARDVVSVKDFGAVGDGVVDDTAAIVAALAAADVVYFPAGTYNVSQIVITGAGGVAESNKTLRGEGAGVVLIVGTVAGTSIIRFGAATGGSYADQGKRADYCNLENISISATAPYTYGVECQWLTNANWKNVSISGGGNIATGMFLDFSWDNDFGHVTIAAQNGIACGVYSPNRNTFNGLRLAGGGLGGVGLDVSGSGNSLFGFDISAFATGVKSSYGGYMLTLHGGYMESNTYDMSFGDAQFNGVDIASVLFLEGVGANVGIRQSGAQSVNGVSVSGSAFRTKLDAVILTASSNSWHIAANTYTACTRTITEGGARHVIEDAAGRLVVRARLDISDAATGGQVKFPAAQNASADANTLDDYDEGSFVPVPNGLTVVLGAGAVAYTGRYIKIGKQVFYSIMVDVSGGATTESAAGVTYFSGMPFNGQNSADAVGSLQAIDGAIISLGVGLVAHSGITRAYTPTWAARSSDVYLSGVYEAAS